MTNKQNVYLGFENELISEQFISQVDFTTNKVGGKPNWTTKRPTTSPKCSLCELSLPLIVQIYAPLAQSPYHRTLYIFGCINPNCWNKKESWVCLRGQLLDDSVKTCDKKEEAVNNIGWCEGADVWDDNEGNGNAAGWDMQTDIDEKSNLNSQMSTLNMEGVSPGEAVGHTSLMAVAEIEAGQDEDVIIDTPVIPQNYLPSLLDEVRSVPEVPSESFEFISFFISVDEEEFRPSDVGDRDRLQGLGDEAVLAQRLATDNNVNNSGDSLEKYEKSVPAHGDKLFHQFVSRIQNNPGQLLRYIRDGGSPLFLYPARDVPRLCDHCHGGLVYELQLLPTLISRLQLVGSGTGHIEFGTVFVLTCQRSCWRPEDTVRSEHILVQKEL